MDDLGSTKTITSYTKKHVQCVTKRTQQSKMRWDINWKNYKGDIKETQTETCEPKLKTVKDCFRYALGDQNVRKMK